GNDQEVFAWKVSDGSVVRGFRGKSRIPWAVGWSEGDAGLAWGNINRADARGLHQLQHSFLLTEFSLGPAPGNYKVAQHKSGGWELRRLDPTRLEVSRNGKPVR